MNEVESCLWPQKDALPVKWVYDTLYSRYTLVLLHNVDVTILDIRKQRGSGALRSGWRYNFPRKALSDSRELYETLEDVLVMCENYVGCRLTPPTLVPEDRDEPEDGGQ